MAAQTLTWGTNSFGDFGDAAQWLPREAPTPNVGQALNIIGGGLTLNGVALDDYTFNLLPGSSYIGITLTNQVVDAETLVRQTAPLAYINAGGNVSNFGEMQFGATGVSTTTNLTVLSGGVFRNTGVMDVSGTFVVSGPGYFVNNGTFSVEDGVAVINNVTFGQAGSSFIVEDATLELNGYTNASVSFAPGSTGRLLFDQPGAANSVAAIKGFDIGDEIVVQGSVANRNYIGDANGGTLFLLNSAGAEVGRIAFSGAYTLGEFTFADAAGGRTSISSTHRNDRIDTGGGGVLELRDSILDLDNYGYRSTSFTVNGANDVTFTLPRGTVVRDPIVQRADFLDGSVVYDSTSPGGRYVPDEDASAVARMYYTVLGRPPEFGGEKYWVDIMDGQNLGIQALAPFFYGSPEFQARYGTNTTDAQFVDLLYRNILGRAGEAGGTTYWSGQLAGGAGRDAVVYAFSESVEHQAIRYDAIERGGIVFAGDPFI